METCYYREQLNTKEKKAYDLLVGAVRSYRSRVILPMMSHDEMNRVRDAVDYDHPEFFYVDIGVRPAYYQDHIDFLIIYDVPADVSRKITQSMDKLARKLVSKARESGRSDLAVAAYLYNYLSDHISYTNGDHHPKRNHNCLGPLVNSECVCEGYSKLYMYLLNKANIPSIIVVGRTTGAPSNTLHCWNLVRIGGRWYHADVTWDSNGKGRKGDWDHFLLSTDDIHKKKHRLLADFKLPECSRTMPLDRAKRRIA